MVDKTIGTAKPGKQGTLLRSSGRLANRLWNAVWVVDERLSAIKEGILIRRGCPQVQEGP